MCSVRGSSCLDYADSGSLPRLSHGTFSQVLDSLRVSRTMVLHLILASMLEQPERWVGRSGQIPWLANSLDFVQLGFSTWRRLRSTASAAELTGAAELRKSENTLRVTF
jgi:hypothetical protein